MVGAAGPIAASPAPPFPGASVLTLAAELTKQPPSNKTAGTARPDQSACSTVRSVALSQPSSPRRWLPTGSPVFSNPRDLIVGIDLEPSVQVGPRRDAVDCDEF